MSVYMALHSSLFAVDGAVLVVVGFLEKQIA